MQVKISEYLFPFTWMWSRKEVETVWKLAFVIIQKTLVPPNLQEILKEVGPLKVLQRTEYSHLIK